MRKNLLLVGLTVLSHSAFCGPSPVDSAKKSTETVRLTQLSLEFQDKTGKGIGHDKSLSITSAAELTQINDLIEGLLNNDQILRKVAADHRYKDLKLGSQENALGFNGELEVKIGNLRQIENQLDGFDGDYSAYEVEIGKIEKDTGFVVICEGNFSYTKCFSALKRVQEAIKATGIEHISKRYPDAPYVISIQPIQKPLSWLGGSARILINYASTLAQAEKFLVSQAPAIENSERPARIKKPMPTRRSFSKPGKS